MNELQAFIWCGLVLLGGAVGYLLGFFIERDRATRDRLNPKLEDLTPADFLPTAKERSDMRFEILEFYD